jgi:hypothetical protein
MSTTGKPIDKANDAVAAVSRRVSRSGLVLGLSPITGTIYLGRLSKKNPNTWAGKKQDVTSNFIDVMLQKFEAGYEHDITVNGKVKFKVTVKEIKQG